MLKKKEEEYMAQQAEKRKKREELIKIAGKLIFRKEIVFKRQVCVFMHIIIIIILAELKMIQGKLSFKRNITKSIILKLIYLKRCTITFFD